MMITRMHISSSHQSSDNVCKRRGAAGGRPCSGGAIGHVHKVKGNHQNAPKQARTAKTLRGALQAQNAATAIFRAQGVAATSIRKWSVFVELLSDRPNPSQNAKNGEIRKNPFVQKINYFN